jgi:hypothetical protein
MEGRRSCVLRGCRRGRKISKDLTRLGVFMHELLILFTKRLHELKLKNEDERFGVGSDPLSTLNKSFDRQIKG